MLNLLRNTILFVILAISGLPAISQTSFAGEDDFENRWLKLMVRRTSVKPDYDDAYGGNTINFAWCGNKFEKGRARIRIENPTLGDAIFLLARTINGKPLTTESGLEYAHGAGFMGWYQVYKNLVVKEKMIFSFGGSFGDYIFGMERFSGSGSNTITLDPAGYFFAGGPAMILGFSIGNGLMLDTYLNYDLSFAKVKYERPGYTPVAGYPKPHFLTLGADITHKSGLWFGFKMNSVVDLGDVNAKSRRMDISIGYYFKSKKN